MSHRGLILQKLIQFGEMLHLHWKTAQQESQSIEFESQLEDCFSSTCKTLNQALKSWTCM